MIETGTLTVNVNHPFSARLRFASSKVVLKTALNLPMEGLVGRFGFLSVRSCFTTGGRCLTDMVVVSEGIME